jgi:WD40 repeat protein
MRFRHEQTLVRAHHQHPGAEGREGRPSDDTLGVAFNATGDTVCFGGLSGEVDAWSTGSPHKEAYKLTPAMGDGKALTSAVSSLAFLPRSSASQRGMLIAACSNGNLSLWHLGAQKCLHAVNEKAYNSDRLQLEATADPNQTAVVAVAPVGGKFMTGGKDGVVRIYDENTFAPVELLTKGHMDGINRAHKLSVTGAKWVDDNTLVTGGWDDALQIWDVRAGHSVRAIHGPQLGGDAVDVHPDGRTIVTGSARSKQQLQFWDLTSGACVADIPWPHEPRSENRGDVEFTATTCLGAKFSPDGKFVAAGGDHDFRIFDTTMLLDGRHANAVTGELHTGGGTKRAVYGVAWAPHSDHVAACGGEVFVMSKKQGNEE